jgi:hypothetical protein
MHADEIYKIQILDVQATRADISGNDNVVFTFAEFVK